MTFLDMEVIIGSAGNPVFLDWMENMQEQIARKPYKNKSSLWVTAKMRYIFHTTGPYDMNKFFARPVNRAQMQRLKALECNWFNDADPIK